MSGTSKSVVQIGVQGCLLSEDYLSYHDFLKRNRELGITGVTFSIYNHYEWNFCYTKI